MADDINEQRRDELTAYLDGELDEATAAAVEQRLRDDPGLRREAETLKRAWEMLAFRPQPEPSTDFAARTMSMAVPIPVAAPAATTTAAAPVAEPAVPTAMERHPWLLGTALAVAAVLVLLAGYGLPGPF